MRMFLPSLTMLHSRTKLANKAIDQYFADVEDGQQTKAIRSGGVGVKTYG